MPGSSWQRSLLLIGGMRRPLWLGILGSAPALDRSAYRTDSVSSSKCMVVPQPRDRAAVPRVGTGRGVKNVVAGGAIRFRSIELDRASACWHAAAAGAGFFAGHTGSWHASSGSAPRSSAAFAIAARRPLLAYERSEQLRRRTCRFLWQRPVGWETGRELWSWPGPLAPAPGRVVKYARGGHFCRR